MKACYIILACVLSSAVQVATSAGDDDIQAIDGCWAGTLALKGEPVEITGHIREEGERLVGVFDVPAIASYGRVFDTIRVDGSTVHMEGGKGRNRLTVDGEIAVDYLRGTWRIGPMSGPIKLERCYNPAPPAVTREDVAFSNGKIRLAGTLVKPVGGGPFPVIVWTHGSGKVTRASWNYSRWVNLLARRGVASLIYDKRGNGESNGIESQATLHDLAGDLLAGVAFVKSRKDFNAKRIGVSGLSQGGWIAPLAASRSTDVAFVVVESAAGMSAEEQDLFVQGNILRRKGVSETDASRIIALRAKLFQFYRTGEGKSALESDLIAAAGESWFQRRGFPTPPLSGDGSEHRLVYTRFELDVVSVWQRVHVPVLAVWGELDRLVPADKSRKIIDAALRHNDNKDVRFETFPGGAHMLTFSQTARDPWRRLRVIPEWPTLLCDWVAAHCKP